MNRRRSVAVGAVLAGGVVVLSVSGLRGLSGHNDRAGSRAAAPTPILGARVSKGQSTDTARAGTAQPSIDAPIVLPAGLSADEAETVLPNFRALALAERIARLSGDEVALKAIESERVKLETAVRNTRVR
jgi:hypothetical protein